MNQDRVWQRDRQFRVDRWRLRKSRQRHELRRQRRRPQRGRSLTTRRSSVRPNSRPQTLTNRSRWLARSFTNLASRSTAKTTTGGPGGRVVSCWRNRSQRGRELGRELPLLLQRRPHDGRHERTNAWTAGDRMARRRLQPHKQQRVLRRVRPLRSLTCEALLETNDQPRPAAV